MTSPCPSEGRKVPGRSKSLDRPKREEGLMGGKISSSSSEGGINVCDLPDGRIFLGARVYIMEDVSYRIRCVMRNNERLRVMGVLR